MNDESIRRWLYGSGQEKDEIKKKLRIYVATPVNARREKTLEQKRKQAALRCKFLKVVIREDFPDAEVVCSFDVCPLNEEITEAEAMGRCTGLLLTCDAIYLDHGWTGSKGCNLEYRAAKIYGCIL